MSLVWKLLYTHISVPQLIGFSLANFCGMFIVLLSIQFYTDVSPVFTQADGFMKKDYLIISKPVNTIGSLLGNKSGFSKEDMEELKAQAFVRQIGEFTSSQFNVSAGIGDKRIGIQMSTALFFESVPDTFIDVEKDEWTFRPSSSEIAIILPRDYLHLYNFGFAKSRNLPQLTEELLKLANLIIRISGNGKSDDYRGKIVGFSTRLNTILVPETFMQWANARYASDKKQYPSRLILEVNNSADEQIARFIQKKGYETASDKLDMGKTTWFLKIVAGIVLTIGSIISLLSFYVLMLSIFLLLQKNTAKLENLLLLGYHPVRVSYPYQLLTVLLNAFVLIVAVISVLIVRTYYVGMLNETFPRLGTEGVKAMLTVGISLFAFVSLFNGMAIRHKVKKIWFDRK